MGATVVYIQIIETTTDVANNSTNSSSSDSSINFSDTLSNFMANSANILNGTTPAGAIVSVPTNLTEISVATVVQVATIEVTFVPDTTTTSYQSTTEKSQSISVISEDAKTTQCETIWIDDLTTESSKLSNVVPSTTHCETIWIDDLTTESSKLSNEVPSTTHCETIWIDDSNTPITTPLSN